MLLKFIKKQLKYGFDLTPIHINDRQLTHLGFWFGMSSVLLAAWGGFAYLQFATGVHISLVVLLINLGIIVILVARVIWLHRQQNRQNPYIVGTAVTPPVFCGRELELLELQDALNKNESLSFVGKRRMGKTSLLRTWQQQASDQQRQVVFIDGQDVKTKTLAAFITAITGEASKNHPDKAAKQLSLWANTQNQPPLILVDEADQLIADFPAAFWIRVRAMIQKNTILWVFASHQSLSHIYQQSHEDTSPFDNVIRHLPLGLLSQAAADTLIKRGGFKSEQRQILDKWAGRQAFFLQSFGLILYQGQRAGLSEQQCLDRFKNEAERHLKRWWDSCNPRQQQALVNLAHEKPAQQLSSLRNSGLVTDENQLFAESLTWWLKDADHVKTH